MFLEPEKFGVEILDSELITGSGLDYVFSRTSALTKWDLLKARANFNQEVEVKAVSLLPSIAEERIIRNFNAYLSFGLTAMWVKLLFKNRRGSNYFGLQTSNGMKEFKEIIKEIDEYKPLRTVSIRNAEDDKILLKTDDGNQFELSQLSSRIFELCSGKITTEQIFKILNKESKEKIDKEVLQKYVLNFFEMLDKEKLITFTRT